MGARAGVRLGVRAGGRAGVRAGAQLGVRARARFGVRAESELGSGLNLAGHTSGSGWGQVGEAGVALEVKAGVQ